VLAVGARRSIDARLADACPRAPTHVDGVHATMLWILCACDGSLHGTITDYIIVRTIGYLQHAQHAHKPQPVLEVVRCLSHQFGTANEKELSIEGYICYCFLHSGRACMPRECRVAIRNMQ
jgi:hypothetical protein